MHPNDLMLEIKQSKISQYVLYHWSLKPSLEYIGVLNMLVWNTLKAFHPSVFIHIYFEMFNLIHHYYLERSMNLYW